MIARSYAIWALISNRIKVILLLVAHSDAKRPLFPIQSGHRFRFNPATDSDAKRPVRLGVLLTLPE